MYQFGQNPLKDIDPRVFTRMLRKVAFYYIPSQLRWRGDNKFLLLIFCSLILLGTFAVMPHSYDTIHCVVNCLMSKHY